MKKRINKKNSILLIFSAILFSTAIYFMSSSLVLGASVGGSSPVTAGGEEVVLPTPTPAPIAPESEQQKETTNENTVAEQKEKEAPKEVYIVKTGQTLWEIAQDSGLSIQNLMNKNQLSSSVIVEGQELVFD
ncbi:hypothetical protein UAW_02433 [Enterococcus haemoperoxidus ATCC BAA-382]|uniref:LysM domain-containing protein n=1 Tax=Enterococcus haemoperoxidus ATCC BAA-382 TaxID=1158608 RepID=R2QC95_9ENTE|nr:LysM peptidoglycan-binding domain-containing protein [Enterococcus haemoperoxidus]EOH94012.1 hypothetical protein UAW_02433 [Enterococcus haemoperoxidus ATCC BAA-382]EOT63320.1 hypothetical protein I583_00120 [Enterococcus haemoperoxidus ATCC BAA-382]OJG54012.1 hypothetical protein RV06_GL000405 [Enterococcus haemoperoxidus]